MITYVATVRHTVNVSANTCDLLRAHIEANNLADIPEWIVGRQNQTENARENTSVAYHYKLNHFNPF